jgi:hypothetical protein
MTVRRALARVVIATAATLAVVAVVGRCERGAAQDIEVELDVGLVPGVRAAHIELRRGPQVIAWAERRYDSGLEGPLRLRAPALGADGLVRVRLETDDGPRQVTRPLTAAAGSTVTVVVGE